METVRLGDLLDIKHGFAFKSEHFADEGEKLVLTPGNFCKEGGLVLRNGKDRFYTGDFPSNFVLSPGDVLIALTDLTQGAPLLGSPLTIPESGTFLHNQRLGKLVVRDPRRIDPRFAYYVFCDERVRAQIRSSATGATVRHTAPERVRTVVTAIPGIASQRKIAAMLFSYDDLIESNAKRIRVLEEMARVSWLQWRSTKKRTSALGEIVRLVRDQVSPQSVDRETRYIGLEHMPRRSICLGEFGLAGDVVSAKIAFTSNDILFGKIRPYFHKVGAAFFDGITSNDTIVMRTIEQTYWSAAIMCVSSDEFVSEISQKANGSKMPRANWADMESYRVPTGDFAEAASLNDQIKPMVEMIRVLSFRNRALRESRDLLLPRLMSGALSVDRIPDPQEALP